MGTNLYTYCRNNPVNYEDEEGTSCTALIAAKVAFDIICDIVVTSAIKEATGEEYTALDLCAIVISSVGGIVIPWKTTLHQSLFTAIVDLATCNLQNESCTDTITSGASSFLGTYFMGVSADRLGLDELEKLFYELTAGSTTYMGLNVIELGASTFFDRSNNKSAISHTRSLHELINIEIPLPQNNSSNTKFGFCPR